MSMDHMIFCLHAHAQIMHPKGYFANRKLVSTPALGQNAVERVCIATGIASSTECYEDATTASMLGPFFTENKSPWDIPDVLEDILPMVHSPYIPCQEIR